ncbi:MAG: T9SS type A sorting domain-containing protein [Ignavibacteriales bacterium]|nr:T9SS type A sorting domain-containing protein [Ignavibacteriales bacterium]
MSRKIFILFLLISSTLFSQAFITNPEFPSETDNIEITFNIKEMTGRAVNLIGYTGILYTHTGVNTNIGNWQHVIGTWGNNTTQPSLTRIGTDLYTITINNPRNFYSITNSTEHISSLNFVLRSADGSLQTEDLFVPIYEGSLNVKIVEPEILPLYPLPGSEIKFLLVTRDADSLNLYIDDSKILSTTSDTLEYILTAESSGRHIIKYIAFGNNEQFADSTYYIVREQLNVADLPEGVETGINYIDDQTVTLVLYAPNKDFVYAIGDFNNWEFDPFNSESWIFDPQYYFNITPDSSTYWLTLTNLTPTEEYRFQYLVDGNLRIADPYSDKILEEEDNSIPESTYPNLIPYPYGSTNFSVSVFQTNQTPFQWEADNYLKPDQTKLIIYELLIRDFVSTHDYKTLIDTLDYLENLGINAVELMPVNEFEGNESWGYNPSFYFAPDKYYGSKNDLKKFIDECHKRNIAVIMDIVLNHSYGRSSFVRLYSSGNFGPPTEENPWYNVASPNPVFSWGFDFNHESEQTKILVDRVNKYWLEEYNFDGFRFDFTKGFTNTPGDGSNYDQRRIDILKRMADKIWEVDSSAYLILEHFAPDLEEKILTDYGMMVWGNNNYNYNEASMGYHDNSKSNFSRISYLNHTFTKPHLVGYMESHDEERLMYKNLQFGNSSGDYDITELNTALSRIKLAAAFFITIPGPKMIWQFGELGYDYSIDYNGRIGNKPIKWDYLENIDRSNLYKTYAALNYLKNNYEAFSTSNFNLNVTSYVKRIQLTHESMNVVIIGNFDVITRSISPSFQNTGIWYDYFSGDSLDVTDTQISIQLNPGEFHIYSTEKLPVPEKDILLGDLEINTTPNDFNLLQNYPNPFNPSTTIKYTIPSNIKSKTANGSAFVQLNVFDILGKRVATLVNQNQKPGNYEVEFNSSNLHGDAQGLSSGIYFYSISAGNFRETKKMIILK